MLIGSTVQQLDKWKQEMFQYQKNKRTKKPFGKQYPVVHHVTEKQVKQQQNTFNPVLQTFKHPEDLAKTVEKQQYKRARSLADQLKHTAKHQKQYDIINLHGFSDEPQSLPKQRLNQVPLRTNYNIVSNQPLPDYHFKNRTMKLTVKPERKGVQQPPRQYNIITNIYKQNDLERKQQQWKELQRKQEQKFWNTHDYNHVNGMYYDVNKEEEYQEQLQKQMKQHGKAQKYKEPPSYLKRLPVVLDPTKQISQEAQQTEDKLKCAKRRFETRYIIEKQYEDRNFQDYLKQQSIVRNKPHENRIVQDQNKQFNIINLKDRKKEAVQSLYGKKAPLTSTWDKIMATKNNFEKYDSITFGKNGI